MDAARVSRRSGTRRRNAAWILALLCYLVVVGTLTLTPAPWAEIRGAQFDYGVLNPAAWLSAQTWTTGAPREFLLNILMFLPLGLLLAHWGTSRASLAATLLTLGIEIAQIGVIGRISDPRDLIANVTGAFLGVIAASLIRRTRRRGTSPHVRNG